MLVPGLTVGVLGQDAVRVRDTASGAASHGSEEGLSSGTERVGGVDAAYAALLEEQFRRSGIMHLMAVSGGHFMVIAGLVHRLCSRVLAPRWATGLVMAVSDVMLAIVVFPSDSVLRALLMGLFGAAAVAAGRRRQSVSSLSWTVIIVLLIAPSMSVSYGFALSCAAVLGIVLFAGPLTDWLACMLPRLLSAPLAMTIAAQSLTLPIQVLMDPQLPLASVPANLLVGPVVGFATMAGLAALFISWLIPQCGYVLAWIAGCGTSVMERVAAMVSDNEFATMPWAGGIPGALLMVLVESACATVLILATRWLRLLRSDGSGDGGQSFRPRLRDRIRIWWSQTVTMFDGDTDGGDRPVPRTKVAAGAIPVASMTGAHDALVQLYGKMETMANKAGSQAPFIIVFGGDAYLNKRTGRDLIRRALHDRPDAERIDLDATGCDQYAFDEAVSPSLLADVAVVVVDNLQNADDKLGESWCATAVRHAPIRVHPASSSAGMKEGSRANGCSTNSSRRARARRRSPT